MAKPKKKQQTKRQNGPRGEFGPPERSQHHGGIRLEDASVLAGGELRARAVIECRLDWYHKRMLIIDRLYEAGLRFRSLWLQAGTMPAVTASYGDKSQGKTAERIEMTTEARRQIDRAMPVIRASCRDAVVMVCGLDDWAGPALPNLRDGLDDLSRHWKMS